MSNLREEFEKLPDIANILINSEFGFNENINQYFHPNHTEHRLSYAFLMGSWYAFQEQQKKIDEVKNILHSIYPYEMDMDTILKVNQIKELLK